MRRLGRLIRVAGLASILVSMSGCAWLLVGVGAGAAVGTYEYIRRELVRTYPQPYDDVYATCETTLKDLGLVLLHAQKDIFGATLEAVTSADRTVRVRLEPKGSTTIVKIRVGTFGDRKASQTIHEALGARLGL